MDQEQNGDEKIEEFEHETNLEGIKKMSYYKMVASGMRDFV